MSKDQALIAKLTELQQRTKCPASVFPTYDQVAAAANGTTWRGTERGGNVQWELKKISSGSYWSHTDVYDL